MKKGLWKESDLWKQASGTIYDSMYSSYAGVVSERVISCVS
jgi:hypothetical protein